MNHAGCECPLLGITEHSLYFYVTQPYPMKTNFYLILFILLITIHFSCSKEYVEEQITGTWQMTECYTSYNNAGDSSWSVVPIDQSSVIEFGEDGKYIETLADSSAAPCTGTYQEIKKNQFQVNSTCRNEPFIIRAIITYQKLIISYPTPDGERREKFLRLK